MLMQFDSSLLQCFLAPEYATHENDSIHKTHTGCEEEEEKTELEVFANSEFFVNIEKKFINFPSWIVWLRHISTWRVFPKVVAFKEEVKLIIFWYI